MQENEIIKIYGTDFRENTKKLLSEARLSEEIGDSNKKILIKPNLVAPVPAFNGSTTHPEVVAGIIEYLQEHGFFRIFIAEGSWVGDKTPEAFDICGYNRLSDQYHVPLLDAQTGPSVRVHSDTLDLLVMKEALSCDYIIDVPVLKGHCQTRLTCALKNMKGLVPNSEKRRFHTLGLHRPIAELNRIIPPDFVVVDHICGDLDFEDGGNPVTRNCIMAAKDPVLTDSYAAHLLHYTVSEIPYLSLAEELGLGSTDLTGACIRTIGEEPAWAETLSSQRKIVEISHYVEEVDSCSACYGSLIPVLDRLKTEGYTFPDTFKICIGQGYRGKEQAIGVGHCTCNFAHFVDGCPPGEDDIYRFLKQILKR